MTIERGDVIQITDENHPWYGCLLVVTEGKKWGAQAFVAWPTSNAKHTLATAYMRPRFEQFERIGRSALGLTEEWE